MDDVLGVEVLESHQDLKPQTNKYNLEILIFESSLVNLKCVNTSRFRMHFLHCIFEEGLLNQWKAIQECTTMQKMQAKT